MQEESDAFNETDNSNSEMMILPQNSHLEVLISDDEQPGGEGRQEYERKLSKKLKEFGFEEEGMTIQQKEELLAVVVASWETAEEEKSRRRLYEEYAEAAEAFGRDGIAISADDALLFADNIPSVSSIKCESIAEQAHLRDNFAIQTNSKQIVSYSPLELCETETLVAKFPYEDQPSTSSHSSSVTTKPRSLRRGKEKRVRSAKHTFHDIEDESQSTIPNCAEKQRLDLENSISMWKPCLSPKDIPLTCSRFELKKDKVSNCSNILDNYHEKIDSLIANFDFALSTVKRQTCRPVRLGKPFHFSRHGHYTKRSGRLDKVDLTVGVRDKSDLNQRVLALDGTSTLHKAEPFSRTSVGAFRFVKNDNPGGSNYMTTRSGARYGQGKSDAKSRTLPKKEVECFPRKQAKDSYSKQFNSLNDSESPTLTDNEVEVILEERLPQFTDMRSGVSKEESSCNVKGSTLCSYPSSSRKGSVSKRMKREVQLINSTRDSDSSDNSSVIDVETIVDDEIEEFVLKRKMIHENHCVSRQNKGNQAKRLKKSGS